MANRKVTDLPEKTVLDTDDWVYLVDREDTTESAQGTSKKAKISAVSAIAEAYADTRADEARDEAKTYADSLVVGLWDDRGNHDASSNLFPSTGGSGTAGAILRGDTWTISVNGVLGSKTVTVGDVVRALTNNPMQNSGNWNILELNLGYLPENTANKQNSMAVDGGGIKFPTVDAVNGALAAKQDTLVSGTNIKTINGSTLLGSGDVKTPILLVADFTARSYTGAGTTTVGTYTIPANTIPANCMIRTVVRFYKTGTNLAFNTSMVSTSSPQSRLINNVNSGAVTNTFMQIGRENVIGGGKIRGFDTSGSTYHTFTANNAVYANVDFDVTIAQTFNLTITTSSTTDTIIFDFVTVELLRI